MKERIISGVIVAVLTFGLVFIGGYYLAASLCLVSVIAYLELTRATKVRLDDNKITGMEMVGIVAICVYYGIISFSDQFPHINVNYLMLIVLLSLLVLLMMTYVFTFPKYKAYQVMNSYFAFVYAPVMLSFILLTRNISTSMDTDNHNIGFFASFLIFYAWASDTFAYFVGVTVGKHKIFPNLSPKKSVEGCIGGILGAGLAGYLYGLLMFKIGVLDDITTAYFLIPLGVLSSVIGQIGDLAASAIKRNFEIKDYGKLIPGHGGIMDRFDSIILTAPFIYSVSLLLFK